MPVYCETGHPFWFMAEPVNTLTNLVIMFAGLAAWRYVRRNTGRQPVDLMVLVFLLIATGLGSFAWHSMRTRTALTLDWLPGVLFLLVFVFLWLRALFGPIAGLLASVSVPGSVTAMGLLARPYLVHIVPERPNPLAFAPFFGMILLLGTAFVVLTWRRRGAPLAGLAGTALGIGAAAAFFRSIDLASCAVLPFGTHFLWHILLSTAAYCCVVLITRLKRAEAAAPKPA